MNRAETVARAYVARVEMEDRLRSETPDLADQMGELRGELHSLLMDAFRESGIAFTDRADAARLAFEMIRKTAHITA